MRSRVRRCGTPLRRQAWRHGASLSTAGAPSGPAWWQQAPALRSVACRSALTSLLRAVPACQANQAAGGAGGAAQAAQPGARGGGGAQQPRHYGLQGCQPGHCGCDLLLRRLPPPTCRCLPELRQHRALALLLLLRCAGMACCCPSPPGPRVPCLAATPAAAAAGPSSLRDQLGAAAEDKAEIRRRLEAMEDRSAAPRGAMAQVRAVSRDCSSASGALLLLRRLWRRRASAWAGLQAGALGCPAFVRPAV